MLRKKKNVVTEQIQLFKQLKLKARRNTLTVTL